MIARRAAAWLLALGLAAVAAPARNASAQSANDALAFEDLGFTQPPAWGARDAALQASAISGSDATAIMGNCAGLTRLKRINALAAIDRESSRVDLTYGVTTPGDEISSTRLAFAGLAYPFPVLRGSLVPAVAVYRAFSSDLDVRYTRANQSDGRNEDFAMSQDGATYAYALAVAGDLSPVLSAGISVYLLHGSAATHRRYSWQPLVTAPAEETFVLEDISSGISGYGAQIGVQLFAHQHLQIGLRLNTPAVVNVSSSRVREETLQIVNDIGSFTRETEDYDTRYLLPTRFAGAIAAPMGSFTLAMQLEYANWGNATIDRHRVYTQSLDLVLDQVVMLAAGGEWSVPRTPLRLRAGYSHAPAVLKYLQTDRLDNDQMVRVETQSGRTTFAAGAAALLFERVVVEGSWVHTTESRETSVLSEDVSETRVSLQGTYWF